MRNLTGTIPAMPVAVRGFGQQYASLHSPQSSAVALKRCPEAVIRQRVPIHNLNPSSHIPVPASDFPNPNKFGVFYW
jgi:hypothetical protein